MEKIVPTFMGYLFESKLTWQNRGEYYKAGAGILAICDYTKRALLVLRKPAQDDPDADKWSTIGGMLDDAELRMDAKVGSREAALREFKEETGQDAPFTRLISSYEYESPDGGFTYYNFIGIVPEEFDPKLNDENVDYKWFSMSDLRAMPRDMFHFGVKLLFANAKDVILEYMGEPLK